MVSLTYPGVYIEEVPSGVHTITGVATSITAFLGRTKAGPVNTEITVTTFGDFERTFGALDVDYPVSYAVSDFFAGGGSQAVIVRLFNDPGAAAGESVAVSAEAAAKAANADVAAVTGAATKASTDIANAAGSTDSEKKVAAAVAKAASDAAAVAGATMDAVVAAAKQAADATTDTSTATYAPADSPFVLKAAGPGSWGNKLYVSVDKDGITDEVGHRYGLASGFSLFNLSVYVDPTIAGDGSTSDPPAERIQSVSLYTGAGERRIDRVLARASNLVVSAVTSFPAKEADSWTDTVPVPKADRGQPKAFASGVDGGPLTDALYEGDQAKKTGLHALDDADLINLMCVPPDARAGSTTPAVLEAALKYCVARRAMLIVDPPDDWSNRVKLVSNPAAALAELNLTGPDARNAFLYYPRVQVSDPLLGGTVETFPACGMVAGLMAQNDAQRGVWVAPAGIDAALGGVTPQVALTDRENGILNPLAINNIRSFPVFGTVMWGARTLRGADQLADEYKYLPVRRMALFLEESLYRGTQWVVFKPNDERLWALIRLNVGAFMTDLFRKGAFQGSKAQDAFFVRCDATTTTQIDIDHGVVNIIVGFAPLKPAEFVVVSLQQITGQPQS